MTDEIFSTMNKKNMHFYDGEVPGESKFWSVGAKWVGEQGKEPIEDDVVEWKEHEDST